MRISLAVSFLISFALGLTFLFLLSPNLTHAHR